MRVISDAARIEAAQRRLSQRLGEAAAKRGRIKVGFRGGSTETEAGWIREKDLWFGCEKLESRYLNAFGRRDPYSGASASIVVEVNPPLEGIDRRMGGAYVEDRDSKEIFLAHRGGVGGGRPGIGKNAFLASYSGRVQTVRDGDTESNLILIASLDDPDLVDRIDAFVSAVGDFKETTAEEAPGDPWEDFISWAGRFFRSDGFDDRERTYKLKIGARVGTARESVLAGDADCPRLLRESFGPPNNITSHLTHIRFLDWVDASLDEAHAALRKLWDASRLLDERISDFLARVPEDVVRGRDTRTTLVSFLLMGENPREHPPYRAIVLSKGLALVGMDEPANDATEAEVYVSALAFFDRILEEAGRRELPLRDRLDAQSVLWSVLTGGSVEGEMPEEELSRLRSYRGEAPTAWWVNQGKTYETEREGGYVTASTSTRTGAELGHWRNVSRLQPADVIVHYRSGVIPALSRVTRRARVVKGTSPEEPERYEARTEYFELRTPIKLSEISVERRVDEAGSKSPFTKTGEVKQVYLMRLSRGFAEQLREEFADRWPEGSPWFARRRGAWLFQANPKLWNLEENLEGMTVGDEDDWAVSRFREEIKVGDPVILWQSGDRAGIYALGEISSDVFLRERPEWRGEGGESEPEPAVRYRLTEILKPPLLKRQLVDHPILAGLSVIQAPQGTNFRVTQEQWGALRARLGPFPPPPPPPTFDGIRNAIAKEGLRIGDRTLRRFHMALQTRGFVILSGVSGTGKSWMTEAYARAIDARYLLVPVAPNWTTNEDLLGYWSPLDRVYHDTPFSRFLRDAGTEYETAVSQGRPPRTYLLALDEMNLARVEYYFAKFLSAMEVRARRAARVDLGPGDEVRLPPNLVCVGTVNVDETTHGFADKVYDRAQLIELAASREDLADVLGEVAYREALLEVWDAISEAAPFAFRIVDEIRAYLDQAAELQVAWEEALDEQLLQKVLPKLGGTDVGGALEATVELSLGRYPLTHAKAGRMLRNLRVHGFTSYF